MTVKKILWKEYRETWRNFSSRLETLQAISESTDPEGARNAFTEVEKARMQHNAARDKLADYLAAELPKPNRPAAPDRPAADEQRIRGAARLIWEFSGKPLHTADSDWHKAEMLVRSAASA